MPSNCTGSAWHCCPAVLRATLACRRKPGLPAGHGAMLITFYRSMPAALCARQRACWVDRLHAWHAASGSLPAFHDRRTTWAVFVADFGTLCLILPSRFVAWPIRGGHLLVYTSKMGVGQRESVLNFPFCFCFATGILQNPASLYQTLFESANKNVFW